MEFNKKLLLALSVLLIGSIQSANADSTTSLKGTDIPSNLDTSLHRDFSWDWNAGGSLDANVSDLTHNFNDLGDNIQVRNLGISMDAIYSILGARLALEDTYENSLKVDANDLQERVKDLYVGIQPLTNTVVIFGRTAIPFGDNVTERAIDINDPIRQLNIDNERHVVVYGKINVDPSIMRGLVQAASIEIGAFNQDYDPNLRIKDAGNMKSYAMRLKARIKGVLFQASTMQVNNGGHQYDASARTLIGPLEPYVEVRSFRKDAIYGNTDVGTAGVAMKAYGGKIYVEGSREKIRGSTVVASQTKNNATLGYSHPVNKYIDASLEGTTNVLDKKDKSVMATVSVHREDQSAGTDLFSNLKK